MTAGLPNGEVWTVALIVFGGSIIGLEKDQIFRAPHIILIPGIAITLTVLAFNLLGDGLRDAFDPRSKL